MFNFKKTIVGAVAFMALASGVFLAPTATSADGGAGETPTFGYTYDDVGNRIVTGCFTEVSGLGSQSEVIEYQDGSDDMTFRKRPGRARFSDITLKKGYVTTADLQQ